MIRTMTCALCLLAPIPAAAQGVSLGMFTGSDAGLQGRPAMVGMAGTAWLHPVGLRLGAAMDRASSPLAPLLGLPPAHGTTAWSADADLLFPGRAVGVQLGALEPMAFVGFGIHGSRDSAGRAATIPVWSYGGAASLPITSWLSLDAEARYRMPHESREDRLPPGVGGGWEYRLGGSVHVGRARAPTRRIAASGGRGGGGGARAGREVRIGGSATAGARAARTLETADRYVGIPYVWGGSTPSEGFDCSGFVQYVFARNGVQLPRVSRDQARAGTALPASISRLEPGDLMFFAGADGVIDHVAIYVGDHRIIHSSGSRGAVGYDDLRSRRGSWYATHLVAARRVLHSGGFTLILPD